MGLCGECVEEMQEVVFVCVWVFHVAPAPFKPSFLQREVQQTERNTRVGGEGDEDVLHPILDVLPWPVAPCRVEKLSRTR